MLKTKINTLIVFNYINKLTLFFIAIILDHYTLFFKYFFQLIIIGVFKVSTNDFIINIIKYV